MPPPSSVHSYCTNPQILENFDMKKYGFGSADAMEIMAEVEKIRLRRPLGTILATRDFVKVPWQASTNKAYAESHCH
ncbi:hypothetical protein ACNKHP_11450 [Shigella boydii]